MIVPSQLAMDKCWVCRQPRNMRQTNRQISGGKNYRQLECQHFKENTPIKLRGRRNYVGRVHFSISRVGRLNRLPAMRRQRRTFIRDLLCHCPFRCFVIWVVLYCIKISSFQNQIIFISSFERGYY
jgi:hypothetical protein